MRHLFGLVAGAALLWLLLSGHYTPLLLGLGAFSIAFTAFVSHRLGVDDDEGVPMHLLWRAPIYLPWLGWQMAKSNISVARRIVASGRAYSPTLARLQPHQRTALGQAIYANSITLTPGTVTISLANGVAEIHGLTPTKADTLLGGEMDRRVQAFEGRARAPAKHGRRS